MQRVAARGQGAVRREHRARVVAAAHPRGRVLRRRPRHGEVLVAWDVEYEGGLVFS